MSMLDDTTQSLKPFALQFFQLNQIRFKVFVILCMATAIEYAMRCDLAKKTIALDKLAAVRLRSDIIYQRNVLVGGLLRSHFVHFNEF